MDQSFKDVEMKNRHKKVAANSERNTVNDTGSGIWKQKPFHFTNSREWNSKEKGFSKHHHMKQLHKYLPITPNQESKLYFLEMIIFLMIMIFCIYGIVYLGILYLQSILKDTPIQSLP